MIKLYNDKSVIVKDLLKFIDNIDFNLTKPQLKLLSNLLSSIILSENITTADISKVYIDDSFLTNNESIQKKIWGFLNNSKFNGIDFYNASIKYIIENTKSLKHNKLVVVMDHMFMRNNFVTLMFTLKILGLLLLVQIILKIIIMLNIS